jgi:hypothetical protein
VGKYLAERIYREEGLTLQQRSIPRFHISRSDLSRQLFFGSSTAHLEP